MTDEPTRRADDFFSKQVPDGNETTRELPQDEPTQAAGRQHEWGQYGAAQYEGQAAGSAPGYGQGAYGQQPGPSYDQQPYAPQYGAGYGAPGYGYAPMQVSHPQAATALGLGLTGLIGGVLCGVLIVLAPIAWYLGAKVKREIDESNGYYSGREIATVGMVLGIIGTVLMVIGFVLMILYFVVIMAMVSA